MYLLSFCHVGNTSLLIGIIALIAPHVNRPSKNEKVLLWFKLLFLFTAVLFTDQHVCCTCYSWNQNREICLLCLETHNWCQTREFSTHRQNCFCICEMWSIHCHNMLVIDWLKIVNVIFDRFLVWFIRIWLFKGLSPSKTK